MVEHRLAKARVASSNLVFRSILDNDTSTLTRLAPTQVELEFSITVGELAAAEERAFRHLAKNVRLPGFRTGKVPRKIFEQTYGSETITTQAIDEVVPEVYAKAVREHDLEPVERPKIEMLEENDGRPHAPQGDGRGAPGDRARAV